MNKKGPETTASYIKEEQLNYEIELQKLQLELQKMQDWMVESGTKVLAIFEGRDAAGKGGTIKRITEQLNPRNVRVAALPRPSSREEKQWYFQRYIDHLPAAGEFILFDRSWYNRAMVEPVMGFCSEDQYNRFLKNVPLLEEMLIKDGLKLFKFYLSVSRKEQKERFEARRKAPLKQFKISEIDERAQELWDQYSVRKFQMLTATERVDTPWTIIRSNDKKRARINCIKQILSTLDYKGRPSDGSITPDPEIIIPGSVELRLMADNMMHMDKLPG